jgi:hypothetical protein
VCNIIRALLLQVIRGLFACPPYVDLLQTRIVRHDVQSALKHAFVPILVPLCQRKSLEIWKQVQLG